MASTKKYYYKETELQVGSILKDANGFDWEITGCGEKQVMAKCLQLTEQTYNFVAHWHFVENILEMGYYTNKLLNKK